MLHVTHLVECFGIVPVDVKLALMPPVKEKSVNDAPNEKEEGEEIQKEKEEEENFADNR